MEPLAGGSPPTSFPFMRLPPELRSTIWDLTLQGRLIMPKRQGHVYCPGPPSIAWVCHESRQVALKNGSPCSFDLAQKCGSTAWFDQSRDVVVWSLGAPPKSAKQYQICPPLWPAVACISVLYDKRIKFLADWARQFLSQTSPMRLKVINVLSSRGYAARIDWGPDLLDAVFGERSALVIDLEDEDQINRLKAALDSDARARYCLLALERNLSDLEDHQDSWTSLVADIKKYWLERASQSGEIRVLVPGSKPRRPVTYDECIQVAMKLMPRIRPAFLIYKKEDDLISMPNRSRGERYPQVRFVNGSWRQKSKHKRQPSSRD